MKDLFGLLAKRINTVSYIGEEVLESMSLLHFDREFKIVEGEADRVFPNQNGFRPLMLHIVSFCHASSKR